MRRRERSDKNMAGIRYPGKTDLDKKRADTINKSLPQRPHRT